MTDRDSNALKQQLKRVRLESYVKLRGGYTIPLAGAIYWVTLGIMGYFLALETWSLVAFIATGLIFPLAIVFSKLLANPFLSVRTPTTSVLAPAFISILLFWVFIVAAAREAPSLIPLILAVGLSIHWPVIGWSYGRTLIYSGHAVVRAVVALTIFITFPEQRLTWLPLSVATIYLLTVLVILVDSGRLKREIGSALNAT